MIEYDDISEAYRAVYHDMTSNGWKGFRGIYDPKHTNREMMLGIREAMEFIAYEANGNSFCNGILEDFDRNMKASEGSARRG